MVGRRGLVLRRSSGTTGPDGGPMGPASGDSGSAPLCVPWWTVQGLSADASEPLPDGRTLQVIEIVTDAGVLTLLAPASDASAVVTAVGRRSGAWRRARRPAVAALARARAMATASSLRWLWTAVGPGALWLASTPVGRLAAKGRHGWRALCRRWPYAPAMSAAASVLLVVGFVGAVSLPGSPGSATVPARVPLLPSGQIDTSTMAGVAGALQGSKPLDLTPATSTPEPAPPSLANASPLQPHEIFGFAPYWTLSQSGGFNVSDLTTIAYFSIDVNADGSLDESGPGWQGYNSQQLTDLVNRAHATGSRVVLTVTCFAQSTLDRLTSDPSAPARLSSAILQAVQAKNLDGVNIDFEGQGSADQAGLTNLVTQVSNTLHGANPHYQVSMDTYASSAADPNGFYDIAALAPEVDAFFVMAYQLNLQAPAQATSPLTSSMYSDLETIEQYAKAVSPSKVILGTPYYGYSWPTNGNTLEATATGPPSTVSYGQVVASGNPIYWDPVTDTAWSSYQVGSQWYETFFEDPSSLYLEAQLAQFFHLAGLGIWALGMDGNDPSMLSALLGFAPAVMDSNSGPAGSSAIAPSTTTSSAPPATTTSSAPPATTTTDVPATTTTSSPTTTSTSSTTSTTATGGTAPAGTGTGTTTLRYSGVFGGETVALTDETAAAATVESGTPTYIGALTGFSTNDPSLSCLGSAKALEVWSFSGSPGQYAVVAETPSDCVDAVLTFPVPGVSGNGQSTSVVSPAATTTSGPGTSSSTSAAPSTTSTSPVPSTSSNGAMQSTTTTSTSPPGGGS